MENDNPIIQIKLNFELKDFKDMYFDRIGILVIVGILIIMLMMIAEVVIYIKIFEEPISASSFTRSIIFLIIFILVYLFIVYVIPRIQFKTDKFLQEEQTVVFSSEKIKISSESNTLDLKWDYVHKIIEYKKIFMILISKNKAFVIPKKFFINPDQIKTVRKLFKDNLPKDKIKLL